MGEQRKEDSGTDGLLADSYCSETDHIFAPPARDLMGRYLGNFMDGLVITAAELAHSAKYQKRLHDAGRTLMNAVDKVGTIQARFKGIQSAQRVKELHALITTTSKKVWDDEKDNPPPTVTPQNFLATTGAISATGTERDYQINRIITEYLFAHKVWRDKIIALMALADASRGRYEFELVEQFLAECLRSDAALDQMLGLSEYLEARVDDLVDLWKGEWKPRDTAAPVVTAISAMIAEGSVPNVRASIEHALMRSLAGKIPLRSAEPEIEIQAVFDTFRRMWLGNGLLGGAKALAMLERRQARHVNNETVTDLLRDRKVLADRVAFLMSLAAIAVGPANRATLKTFIDHYFGDQDFIPRITGGNDAPIPKLQTIAQIHRALRGSWLSDEDKGEYCAKTEAAHGELLKKSRVFEQVEKKGGSAAQKALTLLDLNRKGTFIEGPSQDLCIRLVTAYLKDPSFLPDYVGTATGEDRDRKVAFLSRTLAALGVRWEA